MTDLPTEAVEAADLDLAIAAGRRAYFDATTNIDAEAVRLAIEAAAPHIIAARDTEWRNGIEALRDEWRAGSENAENNATALDRQNMHDGAQTERLYAMTLRRHANALDALLATFGATTAAPPKGGKREGES